VNAPLPIAPELPALVSFKVTVPVPLRPETVPPMVKVAGGGGGVGVGLEGGLPLLQAARARSAEQVTSVRKRVVFSIVFPIRLNTASCWGNAQTTGESPHDQENKIKMAEPGSPRRLTSAMAANKLPFHL
jgi:hypothetical protein